MRNHISSMDFAISDCTRKQLNDCKSVYALFNSLSNILYTRNKKQGKTFLAINLIIINIFFLHLLYFYTYIKS